MSTSRLNAEQLCIRLQPKGERWYWEVAYPQGQVYERGDAATPNEAFALGKLALKLLTGGEDRR